MCSVVAILLFSFAFSLLLLLSTSDAEVSLRELGRPSYYWSNRQLECVNHGLNISRCALKQEGRVAELNPGCFDELDSTNQTRVYCRLSCEESDGKIVAGSANMPNSIRSETTVLRKEPSNNHICSAYHTYNLERRRRDWYIWRSGECITTTITFVLRCGFPSDPRVFYAQNKHLFEYEDTNVIGTGRSTSG